MELDKIKDAIDLLVAHGYEVIPPQPSTILNEEFEQWWNIYDKKRGKTKCLKKWQHMSKKDRTACLAATPKYVASVSTKVYQKDPFTYLNGRCWEDEIYTEYDAPRQLQQRELTFATTARQVFESD